MSVRPVSSVNLLVSLIILGFVKKGRDLRKWKSYKIIISVFLMILIFNYILLSFAYGVSGNEIEIEKTNCEMNYHSIGERNVVLRVDDVQAGFLRELQIRMINDALVRDMTLSLGVIPYNGGNINEDRELYEFLDKNKCNLEIAMHGYDNKDDSGTYAKGEFAGLSYSEADLKLKKGLAALGDFAPITTFVPPNNEISDESKMAVYDNGFKIISAGSWNSDYGFTVSTFDWVKFESNDVSYVLGSCENAFAKGDTCVIMIHPQDYATNNDFDEVKYENYLRLLEGLKGLDANVINFRDFYYSKTIDLD